jgi:hypothetical protein
MWKKCWGKNVTAHFGLLHSMSNLTRVTQQSSNAARLSIPETQHSARQVRHRFRLHSQAQRAAAGPTVEVGEAPPENRVQALPQRQSAIYNPLIADVRVSRSRLEIDKIDHSYLGFKKTW